jgi:eukaryotic-like serine/threonine-protein kinase
MMERDRWEQIEQLYHAALEHGPDARDAFLTEACAGDEDLRCEVAGLLACDVPSDSFIQSPAIEIAAKAMAAEPHSEATTIPRRSPIAVSQIGAYQLLEPLGRGGMGEVHLALDTRLGRKVAVKLLPAAFTTDADRVRRFAQEARAVSALNHPNIITIHEIGEASTENGTTHYIITEYIEGETLRQRIVNAPLERMNPLEAIEVASQIAAALAAAHEAGIAHRDIKPENVMVRRDGIIKVLDFGLAKLTEPSSPVIDSHASTLVRNSTEAGVVLGTPRYMSPEQARGEKLDVRTDIFSLGVMLYEMIAGRAPFGGTTPSEVIASILRDEPPPLAEYARETPPELQHLVDKALRKNREERHQEIKDLLLDLKNLKQDLELAARQASVRTGGLTLRATSGAEYLISEIKRHKLGTLLALVVVAGIAFGLYRLIGFNQSRLARLARPVTPHPETNKISVQNVAQITNWSGLDDFPSLSPDGAAVAYCSDHNGSFEIYVRQLTAGAKEIQLTIDGGQNFQPAWSPDGQRIAYYSKLRGGIWVIPTSGGQARQITDFGSHPAWSPDCKQIAFQANPLADLGAYARNALPPSTLWIVGAQGGEPKQLTQIGDPPGGHGAPSFSPDGKRIVFEVDNYLSASVWTISTGGDDAKRITQEGKRGAYEPIYAPDGKSILYTFGDVIQAHINSDTGEPIGDPSQIAGILGAFSGVRRVSFSANGEKMAYGALLRRESLSSVHLSTSSSKADGAPVPLVQKNAGYNHPTFSPDGKRIAYSLCNIGGTGCDIWVINADGSNEIQLTTNESNELTPSWFPDMEQVSYISKRTGHWTLWAINLNTRREKMLLDLNDSIEYARLSPDGKQIVFNFKRGGGVINVWTASVAGGEPKQLTFDNELMGFPSWSPDGKYIAFQMKRGDDTHIMIMPSGGGTPTQLTFDKGQSWAYDWSPDGDKILFAGFRNGIWNIWWVSRSTKKQQQLTNYTKLNSFVRYPAWSPLNNQVVYEYSETTGNIWVADLK